MDERFNVVLTGQLAGDKTLAEVMSNLAVLFKVPKERASALLSDAPVVIKGSVDSVTSERYKATVERAGARCRIESVTQLELNFGGPSIPTPKSSDQPETVPAPVAVAVQALAPSSQRSAVEPAAAVPLPAIVPAQEEARPAFFSADESIEFEGSVIRQAAASFPNFFKEGKGRVPSNFYCFITKKRLLLFLEDKLFLDLPRSDIQKITKVKLGHTIWHGKNETTLTFSDKSGGEAALAKLVDPSLGGMAPPVAQLAPAAPAASSAWGGWGGWVVALSPLIGSAVNAALIPFYGVRVIMLWFVISAVFAVIDWLLLKQKGHITRRNALGYPYFVPLYLFARARAFAHSKGYAIIGSGLFAVALIVEILHFYERFTRVC